MATDKDGVAGLALYFEFKDAGGKGMFAQFLVFQEMVAPNGQVIPFQLFSRIVSPQNPQRTWRYVSDEKFKSQAKVTSDKSFAQDTPIEKALDAANAYWAGIAGTLETTLTNSWKFNEKPLVLEVSQADLLDIQKLSSPRAFHDRLRRLRLAEGFEALPEKGSAK